MTAPTAPSRLLPGTGEAVLVAEITGAITSTGWLDHTGKLHAVESAATSADLESESALDALLTGLRRACDDVEEQGARPIAIGVGVADSLPTGEETGIAAELSGVFDVPYAVRNSFHAHALGEAFHGNGQGAPAMLFVAIGASIGGAVVINGKVLVGEHGTGGNIGHVSVPEAAGILCTCGNTGHLEGLASGEGILRAYRRHGARAETSQEVFARAADGEVLATNVIADCAFATGRAIGDLINVLGPTLVTVAGEIPEVGAQWWVPLHRGVRASMLSAALPTPVVPAHRVSDGVLFGAAQAALEALSERANGGW